MNLAEIRIRQTAFAAAVILLAHGTDDWWAHLLLFAIAGFVFWTFTSAAYDRGRKDGSTRDRERV